MIRLGALKPVLRHKTLSFPDGAEAVTGAGDRPGTGDFTTIDSETLRASYSTVMRV